MTTDGIRATLERVAPPTSGRLTESGFLLAGAVAGALGWGGTALAGRLEPAAAPAVATALWVLLVAAFGTITVLHGPGAVRFSDAMLVWGSANGTAMAATVAGLAGVLPGRLAFWSAWAGASTVGYLGTGVLLLRAGRRQRGVGYCLSGGVAAAVLTVGAVAFDAIAPVAVPLLGVLHVVPLTVDARTSLSGVVRGVVLAVAVAALLLL